MTPAPLIAAYLCGNPGPSQDRIAELLEQSARGDHLTRVATQREIAIEICKHHESAQCPAGECPYRCPNRKD